MQLCKLQHNCFVTTHNQTIECLGALHLGITKVISTKNYSYLLTKYSIILQNNKYDYYIEFHDIPIECITNQCHFLHVPHALHNKINENLDNDKSIESSKKDIGTCEYKAWHALSGGSRN